MSNPYNPYGQGFGQWFPGGLGGQQSLGNMLAHQDGGIELSKLEEQLSTLADWKAEQLLANRFRDYQRIPVDPGVLADDLYEYAKYFVADVMHPAGPLPKPPEKNITPSGDHCAVRCLGTGKGRG